MPVTVLAVERRCEGHAEQSAPFLAGAELPAPSRVFGFEVTSYVVS
jgi:hypothetical protein